MASSYNTPLADVQWGEFTDFMDSKIDSLREMFDSPYVGKEEDIPGGLLANSPLHIQRLREVLTLRGANEPPIDVALIEKMQPYNRLLMEYQLKTDINGDGKVYNWDYYYSTPQPILSSLTGETGAERIPGEMPPNGLYNGYKVTGTITGVTQEDVMIAATGEYETSVQTNAAGEYALYLTSGSFTLTPSKVSFSFSPTSINVVVASSNIPGNDFVAS